MLTKAFIFEGGKVAANAKQKRKVPIYRMFLNKIPTFNIRDTYGMNMPILTIYMSGIVNLAMTQVFTAH